MPEQQQPEMHVHLPGYVQTLQGGRVRCWLCGRTWEPLPEPGQQRESPRIAAQRAS